MNFALPGILNLAVSTIVFFVALWYINRHLDEQEIPKGMTRSILVFVLASAVSWGAGAAVDWVQAKVAGPQATTKTSGTHVLLSAP